MSCLKENLTLESTKKLSNIWINQKNGDYTNEAISIVKEILLDRGEHLPSIKQFTINNLEYNSKSIGDIFFNYIIDSLKITIFPNRQLVKIIENSIWFFLALAIIVFEWVYYYCCFENIHLFEVYYKDFIKLMIFVFVYLYFLDKSLNLLGGISNLKQLVRVSSCFSIINTLILFVINSVKKTYLSQSHDLVIIFLGVILFGYVFCLNILYISKLYKVSKIRYIVSILFALGALVAFILFIGFFLLLLIIINDYL